MIKKKQTNIETGLEIAVIGMAGRFPGAKNIDEFWENLKNGVESISFFSDEELDSAGTNPELKNNQNYVKAMGVLEDKEYFDSSFFGYIPIEAEIMDPQVRIFHECCWHALEDAGYDPNSYHRFIGLYAGASSGFDWEALCLLSGKVNILGKFAATLLRKDYMCTKTSYKLNLKGPAVFVQTACSTSLVAIHLACQGLLGGECDMALAGGVTVTPQRKMAYLYQEGMIGSPDGHCRAFDAAAAGTIGSEGIGMVVLKRLKEAVADRDYINAVIKGSAINNDGDRKVGFTAPSIKGQAEVIRTAQQIAAVETDSIGYIEAHGTGTTLGDPVEVKALKKVFKTNKKNSFAIGSVKTNMGHLDSAAGVAGFIKTVLALTHRLIPPSLHFETPNQEIDFENSSFYVNTKLTEWRNGKYPLIAGVSSFGIGGTNAHVILEEWPDHHFSLAGRRVAPPTTGGVHEAWKEDRRDYKLIVLSAKTEPALERATDNLVQYLKKNPGINLADAAYTLQVGRKVFKYRRMLVGSTVNEIIEALTSKDSGKVREFIHNDEERPVVFMFAGLGSQYVNMGLELYQKEPLFREEMDRCFDVLKPILGYDIKEILYPSLYTSTLTSPLFREGSSGEQSATNPEKLNSIEIAQIVIFVFEYALAKLLMRWGIQPYAMIGYSLGEYVAACTAGVFALEDALKLMAARGKLIRTIPAGAMLSVPIPVEQLTPLLNSGLSVAIDNGPSCIVAGSKEVVDSFESQMKDRKTICMRMPNSHAIHSQMMDPILAKFEADVGQMTLNKPQIPYISNVTGKWITTEEATDPAYWAKHLRETVWFADGIKELVKEENTIFVEIGPGRDLSMLLIRHVDNNPGQSIINLIRHPQKDVSDVYFLLDKIGRLWLYGIKLDWNSFYVEEKRYRIPLPAYSFEGQHYWIDGDSYNIGAEKLSQTFQSGKKTDIANCVYIPSWKPSALPFCRSGSGKILNPSCWLIFIDESDFSSQLVRQLEEESEDVFCVKIGTEFKKMDDSIYTINPQMADDYNILLSSLRALDKIPETIVHLWGITQKVDKELEFERLDIAQELGFYSLLCLVQAIGRQDFTDKNKFQIKVVTNNMQKVPGEDGLCPEKATVLATVKIIPQEYPNIKCCSIDIALPRPGSWQEKRLRDQLLTELKHQSSDQIIVYRGNDRLVQTYEPITLDKTGDTAARLREHGVYLITGGLDGVGFEMAEYLAQKSQTKLVFIENTNPTRGNDVEQCLSIQNSPINKNLNRQTGKLNNENRIKTNLEEEIDFLKGKEEKIEKELGIKIIGDYQGLEKTIDELCSIYILDYFNNNGIDIETGKIYGMEDLIKKLKILPKFDKFYDFFIKVLKEDKIIKVEKNKIEFLKGSDKFKDSKKLLEEAEKKYPQFRGTLRLLEYCANNYSKALSGEIEAISVLYPDGTHIETKKEYRDLVEHSNARIYILLLKELILNVLIKSPHKKKFRILEIGAGNGFLTRVITPELKDKNVEYYFTDIGNFFVVNAKKAAEKQGFNFMKFRTFDISNNPAQQGFEIYSFDMIVGLDVVSATRCIEESIGNLKQLLVPGARMFLIEVPKHNRWDYMIYGLAEGWWYFQHDDLRKYSHALSLDDWEKAVKKQGFRDVISFPQDKAKRKQTDFGLIISTNDKDSEIIPGDWLTKIQYNENQEIKNKMYKLKHLEISGAEVMVIPADVANQEQMQEAVAQAEEQFGQIRGIIHSAGKVDDDNIQDSTWEKIAGIMAPKVRGTLVLENIFKEAALDFFILCSSQSSVYAPAGMIGCCAANIFLDFFAHYKLSKDGSFIASINWDSYRDADVEQTGGEPANSTIFDHILEYSFPQVVISTRDLTNLHLLEQTSGYVDSLIEEQEPLGAVSPSQPKYQRSGLSSKYEAPKNKIEQTLVDIWQEFLGIEKVGICDDFFELGADSLIFITISSNIHKALNVEIPIPEFFNQPTIKELAKYIESARKDQFFSIKPIEQKEYYPLSSAQKRLYFIYLLEPESTAYNNPTAVVLKGDIDKEKFECTFKELVKRHESLRTSVEMIGEEVMQRIHKNIDFSIEYYDIASSLEVEKILQDFVRPFDPSKASLLRVGLLKEKTDKHILMVDMHHMITDGATLFILVREFMVSYRGETLPPLRIQYKDFTEWHTQIFNSKAIKKQEEYWRKRFEGEISVLDLPTDYLRPSIRSSEGRAIYFQLESELLNKIRDLNLETETTLYMILLAVYNILLSKYSQQEEIVVGTPIIGRNHADLQTMIGTFTNMLAIRSFPQENKRFIDFLREVKENAVMAYENQDYQFEELIAKLSLKVSPGRNPLFDVVLNLVNVDPEEKDENQSMNKKDDELSMKPYELEYNLSKYDLLLRVFEHMDKATMSLEYSTTLFRKSTAEKIVKHYIEILDQVVENKDIILKDITISYDLLLVKDTAKQEEAGFNF